MKTTLILLLLALATVASAKPLKVTIPNVRSDKGTLLVMATADGSDKPVYGMTEAKTGAVELTLDMPDTDTAQVSIIHDQDGDYQMKMGAQGPEEGYARKQCTCTGETPEVEIALTYPAQSE